MTRETAMIKIPSLSNIIFMIALCYTSLSFASFSHSFYESTESFTVNSFALSTPVLQLPAMAPAVAIHAGHPDHARLILMAKDYALAKGYFGIIETAERKNGILNIDAYTSMIIVASRNQDYQRANVLFDHMIKQKKLNAATIYLDMTAKFIEINKSKEFDNGYVVRYMKQLFARMMAEKIFNLNVCDNMIRVAIRNNNSVMALTIFKLTVSNIEVLDVKVYENIIVAAMRVGEFDLVKKLFNAAEEKRLNPNDNHIYVLVTNACLYGAIITKIKKQPKVNQVLLRKVSALVQKDDLIQADDYNQLVAKLKQYNFFQAIQTMFAEDDSMKSYMYKLAIVATKPCRSLEMVKMVKYLVERAEQEKLANGHVYAGFIEAVGCTQDAWDIFAKAKSLKCVNAHVYASLLGVMGDSDSDSFSIVVHAVKIFEEACAANLVGTEDDEINYVVVNAYITVLVKHRQIEKAKRVFGKYYTEEMTKHDDATHDFHGMDFATAYIGLSLMVDRYKTKIPEGIRIDIGKGIHSKEGVHVLLKAVKLFQRQFEGYATIDIVENDDQTIRCLFLKVQKHVNVLNLEVAYIPNSLPNPFEIIYQSEPDSCGSYWYLRPATE